jgi:hypothetical protein
MTRTILAIATAFLAVLTVFASAAEACISCEHVPVVARSSSTSYTATRYTKKRFYARSIARAKARARARAIAAARAKAKARAIAAAKAAAAEDVELAETAAIENSTISTASLDKSETIDTEETLTEEPKVNRNVGCKKFFPSVGMTLTVPCE